MQKLRLLISHSKVPENGPWTTPITHHGKNVWIRTYTFFLAVCVGDPELQVQLVRVQTFPVETRHPPLVLLLLPVPLTALVLVGHPYDALLLLWTAQVVYGHAVSIMGAHRLCLL